MLRQTGGGRDRVRTGTEKKLGSRRHPCSHPPPSWARKKKLTPTHSKRQNNIQEGRKVGRMQKKKNCLEVASTIAYTKFFLMPRRLFVNLLASFVHIIQILDTAPSVLGIYGTT